MPIVTDWETRPFVDITVTEDWTCLDDQTEVFTRPWYGLKAACDCLGIRVIDSDGSLLYASNRVTSGDNCSDECKSSGCKEVDAQPTIWQS